MKVYLINNAIKHPAEKLNVGDFVFCKEQDSLYSYIVNQINPFTLSCIGRCAISQELIISFSDKLVYSYSNEYARIGDVETLKLIQINFSSNHLINKFLTNLLDILAYKEDRVHVSLISEMYRISEFNKQSSNLQENTFSDNFLNYFSKEMIQEFKNAYYTHKRLRLSFLQVRKHYPVQFREALHEFKKNNKNGNPTIYTNLDSILKIK